MLTSEKYCHKYRTDKWMDGIFCGLKKMFQSGPNTCFWIWVLKMANHKNGYPNFKEDQNIFWFEQLTQIHLI